MTLADLSATVPCDVFTVSKVEAGILDPTGAVTGRVWNLPISELDRQVSSLLPDTGNEGYVSLSSDWFTQPLSEMFRTLATRRIR